MIDSRGIIALYIDVKNNISNDVNKETAKENTTNIVDNSKIVENTSDANTISKHDNMPQSNSQTKALANNIASAKKVNTSKNPKRFIKSLRRYI